MSLIDLVLDVHRRLDEAGVGHALSGALALGYYGDPRGTLDADLLVFAPQADADRIVALLAPTGLRPETLGEPVVPVAGLRLRVDGSPAHVDLFFALDERFEEIRDRTRTVPFGPDAVGLPILSADDLVVFKLSFGRPKDWVDIEGLLSIGVPLELDRIADLVVSLRGPSMHPRVARLRRLAAEAAER